MSNIGDQLRLAIQESQGKADKGDKRVPVEVPPEIHAALKSLAARESTTMRALALEGLAHIFDKYDR
ncbi:MULTISPECIES: ribbon-helix-helix domain-containing protein [Halomonadaceae]|uniref:ribbon-helix-helix domain-containing protein n=1 Tax=Halomonadaceae TaxID=28256 RepID=UPI00399D5E09